MSKPAPGWKAICCREGTVNAIVFIDTESMREFARDLLELPDGYRIVFLTAQDTEESREMCEKILTKLEDYGISHRPMLTKFTDEWKKEDDDSAGLD